MEAKRHDTLPWPTPFAVCFFSGQAQTKLGLTAEAAYFQAIPHRSQRAGVVYHRPVRDEEFLAIVLEQGTWPGERPADDNRLLNHEALP